MKNKNFIDSVRCAFRGMFRGLKTERNFRIYILHVLLTLPFNVMLHFSMIEWIAYMICVLGVFSAECFNTVIEKLCDIVKPEYDDRIKFIKDLAAAGVLYWGFAFYIAEALMIGVKILA